MHQSFQGNSSGTWCWSEHSSWRRCSAYSGTLSTRAIRWPWHRDIHGTLLTWEWVRGTRVVWLVVLAITIAQFAVTYLPPLQDMLGTQSMSLFDGLLTLGIGAVFFAIIEIEKQTRLGLKG
ncbi:MAG: cation transporting ATPase C-terminal domain-containing protein [Hyphomicrobiales bacterium]